MGGEPLINLKAGIQYPWYYESEGVGTQRFPFRTLSMILSFTTVIVASLISKLVFEGGYLPKHYDLFQCVVNIPDDITSLQEPYENGNGELTMINLKKNKPHGPEPNGINPSLKITKEDIDPAAGPLLDPGTGPQINKALEVSPNTEIAPPIPARPGSDSKKS